MAAVINLQNTPDSADISVEKVSFMSNGVELQGLLFKPADASEPLPAALVTGAWTTVKEQMAGTYARELAKRGVIGLAFDFTGWGESSGDRRYVEDPVVKTADIQAAAEYLAKRDDVNTGGLSGLGICASSGYMADAVASSEKLSSLALIAPWLHDPAMVEGIYGGPESVSQLIAASEAEEGSKNASVVTAASASDEKSLMYQAPYYTENDRGLIDQYDNKFSVLTWKPWLTYDAQQSADQLSKPVLMVGSEGMALPAGADAYEKRTRAPLEKVWLADDVSQFDFYDRVDIVNAAADAVADFFKGRLT